MRKDIWWKNMNMPLAFIERHLDKWIMTEIYLLPTCSLSCAQLISDGKSLMSGLCPTENMSMLTTTFNIFLSGTFNPGSSILSKTLVSLVLKFNTNVLYNFSYLSCKRSITFIFWTNTWERLFSCADFFINLSHYSRTYSKTLCILTQFTCPVANVIIKTCLAKKNVPILSSLYATEIQQKLYTIKYIIIQ